MTSESLLALVLGAFIGFIFAVLRDQSKTIFEKKLSVYSDLISELNKHRYVEQNINKEELIILFAPARLISNKKLEVELREYFSSVVEYWDTEDSQEKKEFQKKIGLLVMKIEQLMRAELVGKSLYTHNQILDHINS